MAEGVLKQPKEPKQKKNKKDVLICVTQDSLVLDLLITCIFKDDLIFLCRLSRVCKKIHRRIKKDVNISYEMARLARSRRFFESAGKLLIRAGENGNALAMHELSLAYRYGGWGLSQNQKKYLYWQSKAIERDYERAILDRAIEDDDEQVLERLSKTTKDVYVLCHFEPQPLKDPLETYDDFMLSEWLLLSMKAHETTMIKQCLEILHDRGCVLADLILYRFHSTGYLYPRSLRRAVEYLQEAVRQKLQEAIEEYN